MDTTVRDLSYCNHYRNRLLYGVATNDLGGGMDEKIHTEYERRVYRLWTDMLGRCYCRGPKHGNESYYDVSVCDRWLTFSNFVNDLKDVPGYMDWLNNKGKYEFDKDSLILNNKQYGPGRVMFITKDANNLERRLRTNNAGLEKAQQAAKKANSKKVKVTNLKEDTVNIYDSYVEVERAYNLPQGAVSNYFRRKAKNYKQFLVFERLGE